jgi:hypothetical protein
MIVCRRFTSALKVRVVLELTGRATNWQKPAGTTTSASKDLGKLLDSVADP